jgi:hypothetical protein
MNRRTFATQAGTFLAAAIAAPALRARPTAGNGLAPHTSIHRVEADGVTVSSTGKPAQRMLRCCCMASRHLRFSTGS